MGPGEARLEIGPHLINTRYIPQKINKHKILDIDNLHRIIILRNHQHSIQFSKNILAKSSKQMHFPHSLTRKKWLWWNGN